MAGSVVPTLIEHRSRGVVRTDIVCTLGADGSAVADTVVGVGFGRLVGVAVKGPASCTVTVTDNKSGAVLVSAFRPTTAVFGNTTTGDTTGGTSEDLWTTGAAHNLVAGDQIVFTSITGGGSGVAINTPYWVVTTTGFAATTFCLAASAAAALAGTPISNVGSSDVSAATWYKAGAAVTPAFFRPTGNVTVAAGTALAAHANNPNVNRDMFVGGKVSVSTSAGATGSPACTVSLIIDEEGIGGDYGANT